ncbi:MAG: hypothetical protein R3Y43_06075 [Alphaproteobacteria bacterium]
MAKIAHYEVYVDKGSGWELLGRFGLEERSYAFNLAKDKARSSIDVKIIKETFDHTDGSYTESVEYIKVAKKAKQNSLYKNSELNNYEQELNKVMKERLNVPKATQALIILVSIILVSGIAVNLLGTLVLPFLENILPSEVVGKVFFFFLFAAFVLIALPLALKKVPWNDLSISALNTNKVTDEVFYNKAKKVENRYDLNDDFADDKTPIYPEASILDKKDVVAFVAQIFSILKTYNMSSFNRLGIKLMVYGGILELANYRKLDGSNINSLLSEAILILDGQESDLVHFYQAKRSFKDNNFAVYLTGLGAFLMDKYLSKRNFDEILVVSGFERWEKSNKTQLESSQNNDKEDNENSLKDSNVEEKNNVLNIVSIKHNVKLFDVSGPDNIDKEENEIIAIRAIINKVAQKYSSVIEERKQEDISSLLFEDLAVGIAFAKQALSDINEYVESVDDENIIYNIKCNIVKKQDNNDNYVYIDDLFTYTNDDEILTTANVVNEAKEETKLEFESVGKKLLQKNSKTVELFKVL